MKRTRIKTQVGALSGPEHGITEHPSPFLRPLRKPLFDQEVMPKGSVRGRGFEILGPVKTKKNKGRYVVRSLKGRRPCHACIYLGDKVK